MSLDGIQDFIYDTTNNNLLTSKGSFYLWNKEIYNLLLNTKYKYIQSELMNALVLHVDESPNKLMENCIINIIFQMVNMVIFASRFFNYIVVYYCQFRVVMYMIKRDTSNEIYKMCEEEVAKK